MSRGAINRCVLCVFGLMHHFSSGTSSRTGVEINVSARTRHKSISCRFCLSPAMRGIRASRRISCCAEKVIVAGLAAATARPPLTVETSYVQAPQIRRASLTCSFPSHPPTTENQNNKRVCLLARSPPLLKNCTREHFLLGAKSHLIPYTCGRDQHQQCL